MNWTLPTSAIINGREYQINPDYRDILDIISRFSDESIDFGVRAFINLSLFYKNFEEIEESEYNEALSKMLDFIACGEERDGKNHPKTIDWDQDYLMIVSEINKAAGYDVRGVKFLHWFTFISLFNTIGDGQLSLVVSIREKLRKNKKLEKWEQDFYRENRTKIDFKSKKYKVSQDVLQKWL